MSSRREQIMAAVVTALNTGRPGDIPEFKRDRLNPFAQGTVRAGNVRMAPIAQPQESVELRGGRRESSLAVRSLRIGVEHFATGNSSEVLDEQLAWAVKTLANSRLGGLAHFIVEESTSWDEAALEADYRRATQIFLVRYETAAADLESDG